MEFEKVTELIPGTKYKIKYCGVVTYEGIYLKRDGNYRIFKNATIGNTVVKLFKQDVSGHHIFYVPIFQRDRIQSDMEQRAVNKLLQQIIGDPTFYWVGPYNPVIMGL